MRSTRTAVIFAGEPLAHTGATAFRVRGVTGALSRLGYRCIHRSPACRARNPLRRAILTALHQSGFQEDIPLRVGQEIHMIDKRVPLSTRRTVRDLAGTDIELVVFSSLLVASRLGPIARPAFPTAHFVYMADNDELQLHEENPASFGVTKSVALRVLKAESKAVDAADTVWSAGLADQAALALRYPDTRVINVPQAVGVEKPATPPSGRDRRAFTYGTWSFDITFKGLANLVGSRVREPGDLVIFGRLTKPQEDYLSSISGTGINLIFAGFAATLDEMVEAGRGPAVVPVWTGSGVKTRTTQMASRGVPVYGPSEAVRGLPEWIAKEVHTHESPSEILETAWASGPAEWSRASALREALQASYTWETIVGDALSEMGLS